MKLVMTLQLSATAISLLWAMIIPPVAAESPKEIPLFPGTAPGSERWDWPERALTNQTGLPMVQDVVRPVLLHYPADRSKAVGTAMIVAPGGGFRTLMMSYEGTDIARRLNAMGVDSFVLKYRLMYSGPGAPTNAPRSSATAGDRPRLTVTGAYKAQDGQDLLALASEDGKQAVRVVRQRAGEFGVRPNRIGLMGFSAGGIVTSEVLFGPLETRPDFAAIIYGAGDIRDIPDPAPSLFLAVAADDAWAANRTIDLFTAYRKGMGQAELHVFQMGAHGFLNKGGGADHFMDRLEEWLGANQLLSRSVEPAPDSAPAPSNIPGSDYPRIGKDRTATFRVKAPEAKQVRLEGGAGLVKAPLSLSKETNGWWTVTTEPAVPGFHYYWFNVDGLRVNDGSSYGYFGYGRETSGIEIPEAGVDFYSPKDVPHGQVRSHWFYSQITGTWRRAFVYTPPDYDRDSARRYPVLYLQHGAGENERGWIDQGHADFILDNLFAEKKAVPMIVVMNSGYAAKAGAGTATGTNALANMMRTAAAFEEVMLNEVIPSIDAQFRTRADRESRAMAGLSMGSMQTLNLTLHHLDQFAWIAAMSRPPIQEFDVATAYDGAFRDPAHFNSKVKLLWFSAGTAETRFHAGTVAVHEALEKAGIPNTFYSSSGTDHEWQTWRRSLHELAPKLFQSNQGQRTE